VTNHGSRLDPVEPPHRIRASRTTVALAAHSPQIDELEGYLLTALAPIDPRACEIPFCSSVVGGMVDTSELNARYWYRNLRNVVRFERATMALVEQGYRFFVELSPHPVLTTAVQETIEDAGGDAVVVETLRRGHGGMERFLLSLAQLQVRGIQPNWEAVFAGTGARRVAPVSCSRCQWAKSRYCIGSGASGHGRPARPRPDR
jgi:acyl transferase domain-containing protein